ncbi:MULTISPECIES: Dps family protein [unclassified Nocardia]|uniref:Dps family protein n=1 Tax=unclassified Nocardia TaxID=2637762 RepID=UPI001CE492E2|nr:MULTISPECIES: DNA starvation/stationary phase protection protein [unclassified Nocardia]
MSTLDTSVGYRASTTLAGHLQRILVDLIALQLNAKQAHWNVVGHNFRDLHLQLDEIVGIARTAGDTIAERMRALDAVPDGRPAIVAGTDQPVLAPGEQDTSATVHAMTEQLRKLAAVVREVHDEVDAEDPSTSDLLHTIITEIEQQAWMMSAENRGA